MSSRCAWYFEHFRFAVDARKFLATALILYQLHHFTLSWATSFLREFAWEDVVWKGTAWVARDAGFKARDRASSFFSCVRAFAYTLKCRSCLVIKKSSHVYNHYKVINYLLLFSYVEPILFFVLNLRLPMWLLESFSFSVSDLFFAFLFLTLPSHRKTTFRCPFGTDERSRSMDALRINESYL